MLLMSPGLHTLSRYTNLNFKISNPWNYYLNTSAQNSIIIFLLGTVLYPYIYQPYYLQVDEHMQELKDSVGVLYNICAAHKACLTDEAAHLNFNWKVIYDPLILFFGVQYISTWKHRGSKL